MKGAFGGSVRGGGGGRVGAIGVLRPLMKRQ